MTGTIWDEIAGESSSVKLTAIGDVFEGEIAEMKTTIFDSGKALTVVLADGRFHHVSTVDGKAKFLAEKPAVGDRIRLELVALVANKHGGKSKVHTLKVDRRVQAPAGDENPPF